MRKLDFSNHRKKFLEQLKPNSINIVYSGNEVACDRENNFPFQVDSDFYYLTGLEEPNNLYVAIVDEIGNIEESLYIPKIDSKKALWVGACYTPEEAREISGIKNINYINDLDPKLFSNEELWYPKTQIENQRFSFQGLDLSKAQDLSPLLDKLRLVKNEDEILTIKEAGRITGLALSTILEKIKPGINEKDLEALFEYTLIRAGANGSSFDAIVASGKNALNLHYTKNNADLKSGELILFDVGADYKNYSGDVSRTYPINGKFNEIQKKFYQAVLNTQKELIKHYVVGAKLKDLQLLTKKTLEEELKKVDITLPEGGIEKWYYHGIGHSLGIDTHDSLSRDLVLEDNMIITCEPGLYAKEYGIGIRIEDDILINGTKPIILTAGIPKEIDEIEAQILNLNEEL